MEDNPKKVNLKEGRQYKFCTCGASKIIPFCDDSHRELNEQQGTNYKSLKITPKEYVEIEVSSKTWNKNH